MGVEGEGFNVIRLGEEYGEGDYKILRFVNGRLDGDHSQTVDARLGPREHRGSANPDLALNSPSVSQRIGEDKGALFKRHLIVHVTYDLRHNS